MRLSPHKDAREESRSLYARVGELQDCLRAHPASMVGHKLDKKFFYQSNLRNDNWNFELTNLQNQTVLRVNIHQISRQT